MFIIEYFKRIRYMFESILFMNKLINIEIHFNRFLKRCKYTDNVSTNLSTFATLGDYIEYVEKIITLYLGKKITK